jgi:cystathionine beta-lyase family protein involved in aluminum resistance
LQSIYQDKYSISEHLIELLEEAEIACESRFRQFDRQAEFQQIKLLKLFQDNQITDFHLHGSTGYGYGDVGRDALESIFAGFFGGEAALVRSQIVSGTHALALGLLGNLRHGQEMISAIGRPYDTMLKVIGLHGEKGSLIDSGIAYREVDLTPQGHIDLEALKRTLSPKTGLVLFQRSKGYQWRPSTTIDELTRAIRTVKEYDPDIICMVDNCYCEMIESLEPGEVGADLVAGSLIKNPGGGLARCGGYLAGKKEYISAAARRLTAPGLGQDIGASLEFNRTAYQGFFQAPLIVAQAVKGAELAAEFFTRLGYEVLPEPNLPRVDIVQAICLNHADKLISFCQGIQKACPLDSMFVPEPAMLPGYDHPVIMAGGTFIQGSSIELSADGPLREPYIAYMQGGLSLAQIKLGILLAAREISKLT